MRISIINAVCMLTLVTLPAEVHAALVTSLGGLSGTPTEIDFSQFTGGSQLTGVNGPVQIGGLVGEDITVSDVSAGTNLWLYDGFWGLSGNGSWGSGRVGFLGVFPGGGPARIDFNDGPISGFAAFLNYVADITDPQYTPVILSAYDAANVLLETYVIDVVAPISTPGGLNEGAFRGIQRAQSDIAYIEYFGDTAVLDDLNFVRVAEVPEPTSIALFGLGGLGLAFARRRRNA